MAKLRELQLGIERMKAFEFDHKKKDGSIVKVKVMIRLLNGQELDCARVDARNYVIGLDPKLREGRDYTELLEDEKIREVLSVALRDPDKPEEPWSSPVELRTTLDEVELALLWNQYLEWQSEAGPIITHMDDEQIEAMVKAVASEVESDPLSFLDSRTRRSFTRFMARELLSLRMASALPSTHFSEQPSESENKPNEDEDDG